MIYLAIEGEFAGYLALADTLREESTRMIARLSELGVEPVLLTGDHANAAEAIAGQLLLLQKLAIQTPLIDTVHILSV